MERTAPKISGNPSLLGRLKALPEEEQDFLREQKTSGQSPAKLIVLIAERYGIDKVTPSILTAFWRWHRDRQEIRDANASVEDVRKVFAEIMPDRSEDETHRFLVEYLAAQGLARKDSGTLRFATVEMRKRIETAQKERRVRLMEEHAAKAKEVPAGETLTPAQRMEKIKEVFGIR
jgi:hypothetical protein